MPLDVSGLGDTAAMYCEEIMSCKKPLIAIITGYKANGKLDLKFIRRSQVFLKDDGELIYTSNNGDRHMFYPRYTHNGVDEYLLISCGQCIGCLLKRSRDWATRCYAELAYHDKACFVTLTYDDFNVPVTTYVKDGETKEALSLRYDDIVKFMKRLRKKIDPARVRYYACGEYGSRTQRPHYHAIIFGYDFSKDAKLLKMSKDGFPYFTSEELKELWPFGHHLICDVNWSTCAYVARYCTKKEYGKESFYTYHNVETPKSTMSLKPGIGRQYYEDHKSEIYENYEMFVKTWKGGMKTRPPRYFDRLYDIDKPFEMRRIREISMEMSDNISSQKLKRTSLSLLELLEVEENEELSRTAILKRDII